ncbi:MAG: hypothetical protein ABEI75_00350 [Halobaculum sp.]
MSHAVTTTATQALRGLAVARGGKTQCTDCHRTVREGDAVAVHAVRPTGAASSETTAVYCRNCRDESLPHRAEAARQVTAYARLGVTTDAASRDARLTLRDPEPVAHADNRSNEENATSRETVTE